MPTLTPEEIAQLNIELTRQQGVVTAFTEGLTAKQDRIDELEIADGAFKKFFDYYNDDIIAKYDAERKALDGQYIASPITEADIIGPASVDGSVRTTPTTPTTNIVRVAQFDGGPLISTNANESTHITNQTNTETGLTSGFGSGSGINGTTRTDSSLTSGSTTLNIRDTATAVTSVVNDVFAVYGGGDAAIIQITSVANTTVGMGPPFTYTWGINVLVAPTGTIASNSNLITFSGFNNTERTDKVASNSNLQPIMDNLITTLEAHIQNRITRLTEQTTALNTNLDPYATSQITTALTNVSTSSSFLTTYLNTTIISDAGLSSLASERATRGAQITARVSQIINNYTNQAENFYNKRYALANNRGNTASGTLRLVKAAESALDNTQNYITTAQQSVDAITELLG